MLSFSTQRLSTAILLLLSSCSVYSLPASPHTTSTASLANTVPNCAFECTEKLIEIQWPTSVCSDRSEIDCFCKTNTASGYTLGESVLGCMLSYCPNDVISASSSAGYSICKGVEGALPNTHSTLTATLMTETSSPTAATLTSSSSSSLTSSAESTSSLSDTTTSHTLTSTLPHVTTFQSPIGTGTEPVTSALSSDATASSSPTPTPGGGGDSNNSLNAGSVVGVSVVSGLSGFFLVGVAIFFFYRKMRSKRREDKDRDYFEIGGKMSEPLGFGSTPPRRPSPRPKPPPKPANQDTETSRLMSPFESRPRPPNPAVIVTEADDGDHGDDGRRNAEGPGRIGHTLSDVDVKDSPQTFSTFQRTPSDFLPDRPEYGLYPEPLRWDRKYSRPPSDTTTFEEDVSRPRSFVGPSNGYPNFSGLIGPRPYINRRLMPGLPANPRAMLQGFGPRNPSPPKQSQESFTKPVFLNPEPRTWFSFEAPVADKSNHYTQPQSYDSGDYVDDYWQESNNSEPRIGQPSSRFYGQMINHKQPEENPNPGFETIGIHRGPESHRTSRHSGFIRPLTPVREVRTPTRNLSNSNIPDRIGYSNGSPPERTPRIPVTPDPAREIVSRPRIVRQHDIKRVEIRRGKPHQQQHSKESNMPYSPEDYWAESSRCSASLDGSCTSATPATSSRLSGGFGFGYQVEKTITRKPTNRESPLEHNLTPSRRGGDLILRVDAF